MAVFHNALAEEWEHQLQVGRQLHYDKINWEIPSYWPASIVEKKKKRNLFHYLKINHKNKKTYGALINNQNNAQCLNFKMNDFS